MAAGLVSHNITTASGVTFAVVSWVPDTGSPDVGAVPIARITDGTSVAAVKAASTAAATTDPAVVVALSPASTTKGAGAADATTTRVTIDSAQLGALGQTTMSASAPISIASDQTWPVGAVGFAKAEDVASASGDVGIPAMAIQQSSPADTAANADYAMLQMSGGRLWGSAQAYGDIAHDAADSGNPIKNGYKATTSLAGLTLVADADRTNGFAGVDGVQIVRPHCNLEDIVSGNATNTDGTSTQCIAAQAASIKTYLTSVVLCNTSATAITVDIKDGTTVKVSLPLPAGSGCIYNPPIPIPGTAATAWNFDGSAAATTVTCSMLGFKSKV